MNRENDVNSGMMVSVFQKFKYIKDSNFKDIILAIREGRVEPAISTIRTGIKNKNREWEKIKLSLPAFTASGIFNKVRQEQHLVKYNKLIVLDWDDVEPENIKYYIDRVNVDPYTYASFISPSGMGFKVFVKVSSELENHAIAFLQSANYYEKLLGINNIDKTGKDPVRLCYVSSDKNAFFNEYSIEFNVETSLKVPNENSVKPNKPLLYREFGEVEKQFQRVVEFTKIITQFTVRNRNNFVNQLANNCNRWGIPRVDALRLIINSDYNYDEKEIVGTIYSAYNNVLQYNSFPLNKLTIKNDFASSQLRNFVGYVDEAEDVDRNDDPIIAEDIYRQLPELLQKGCSVFNDPRQKDIFLTGALGVLSGCFPKVFGTYHMHTVYPNLYAFISAPPASGKGALVFSKNYGKEYHKNIISKNLEGNDKSKALLFIPGNASAAALMSHLSQNDGQGIFFESEADSLSNTFKNEWGNFSDTLRKAFQHENVSYTRKANNEYLEIEQPKLSVVLSGTPKQVQTLTKSVEDGLFSRFLFYSFKSELKWEDVSPNGKTENYTEYFKSVSNSSYSIIEKLLKYDAVEFTLTENQWIILNQDQEATLFKVAAANGIETAGLVKRMGLMWFRISMLLTIIRSNGIISENKELVCTDEDFQIAQGLMKVYGAHIINVYNSLPKQPEIAGSSGIIQFYNNLPEIEFQRKFAVEVGKKLNFGDRDIDRFLKKLVDENRLSKTKTGFYIK